MNDLYTRPGPGAAGRRDSTAENLLRQGFKHGIIVGIFLSVVLIVFLLPFLHAGGAPVSETYTVHFDGPAKVGNYWTSSRIIAGDAHDIGPKPCCGSMGQIVVHREGDVYGVVIQEKPAQNVSFNWPFVWGMVLLMVALIALYFGRFARRNSRMHFGGAR